MHYPVLYTFRRCPYAIRARMALYCAGQAVEIREVRLANKPKHLLALSPKGTVPVLWAQNGKVIDESLAIMQWALQQGGDPENWLNDLPTSLAWVQSNDQYFKPLLDRYKYADQSVLGARERARQDAEPFCLELERKLCLSRFLGGAQRNLADVALFPFVRQFAGVEPQWFAQSAYPAVREWLQDFLTAPDFKAVMEKYPVWSDACQEKVFLPVTG